MKATFLNTGRWNIPNINALQLSYVKGLEISHNRIDNVMTSKPDGDAIILDYLSKNNGPVHISEDCIIHHNIISGCMAGSARAASNYPGSAGIGIFRGRNNLVYSNFIFNCSSGISLSSDQTIRSTGNKIFNNTVMRCVYGVLLSRSPIDDTQVFNNLLLCNSEGMHVSSPQDTPLVLDNNMFCANYKNYIVESGHTISNIKTTSQIYDVEPLGENGWILSNQSPCVEAGNQLPADARIDTAAFGLNGMPASNPPSIGAWQKEV